jgi:NAD-dependent dihydropyrimidine dehydrogenase PreA subunit
MRRPRGRMRPNNTGMRGRRGNNAQRSGKRFVNGMTTKGMGQTPLSHDSLRYPSPDPTGTTRSRDQKIQALKRQVRAVRAELDSLEMRTRTVRDGSTISGIRIFVDTDRCVGCGICQGVCPVGAISVENVALVDSGRCTGCRLCLEQCPVGALSIIPLKNL